MCNLCNAVCTLLQQNFGLILQKQKERKTKQLQQQQQQSKDNNDTSSGTIMFETLVLLLTPHKVHEQHNIQVSLMINILTEKGEKYDLFMVVIAKLFGIVLLQHKIQHNLMKYEITIYTVHVMHVQQLNLIYIKILV